MIKNIRALASLSGLITIANYSGFSRFISDEVAIKAKFKYKIGKKLDLNNPHTFNEKLQWLKIHDHNPEYTRLVDKIAFKDYIAENIGAQYIVPTIGVWDKFDDIDFDKLPDKFVLKCNHDSGGLVICKDKSKLDIKKARRKINKCLKTNYYDLGREWPYKNVKPQILAEEYLDLPEGLVEYKMFSFNGESKIIDVCMDTTLKKLISYVGSERACNNAQYEIALFYMNLLRDCATSLKHDEKLHLYEQVKPYVGKYRCLTKTYKCPSPCQGGPRMDRKF